MTRRPSSSSTWRKVGSGQPPPDPGEAGAPDGAWQGPGRRACRTRRRYGQDAANHLAKADEEWADWERRLAAARVEWGAPEILSEPLRKFSANGTCRPT